MFVHNLLQKINSNILIQVLDSALMSHRLSSSTTVLLHLPIGIHTPQSRWGLSWHLRRTVFRPVLQTMVLKILVRLQTPLPAIFHTTDIVIIAIISTKNRRWWSKLPGAVARMEPRCRTIHWWGCGPAAVLPQSAAWRHIGR